MSVQARNMNDPEESRSTEKTTIAAVHLGDATVARLTLEPGWKWSECIKPVAGTESCQASHLGFVVSGQLHVTCTDGSEADLRPGDAYRIAPGHDAWVDGQEQFVAME